MIRWIQERPSQSRLCVHPVVAGGLVSVILAWPANIALVVGVAALLLGTSVVLEVLLLTRQSAVFAEAHALVYVKSSSFAVLVDKAVEKSLNVEIVGGTLLSLTDQERNLHALARLEEDPRILLMHPDGSGIAAAEKNRATFNRVPSYDLKVECRRSILRIISALGMERSLRTVRLYEAMPTTSIYRLGDTYVLTCYTFGRGGGSPSILVRRGPDTERFCRKLNDGISALWDSATELTPEFVERVRLTDSD